MRAAFVGMALFAAGATTAHSEIRAVNPAAAQLWPTPIVLAPLGPVIGAQRFGARSNLHLGQFSPIRSSVGGMDGAPFMTSLRGGLWHGRMRSFGSADGTGLSGIAVRGKSVGFDGLQSERHASGFLATELRYGIAADEDDLLTIDMSAVSQRMPGSETIARYKSVKIRNLYFGAVLTHGKNLSLSAGRYRLSTSDLSPFDYAIERVSGMPAAGDGLRLGVDWRLNQAGASTPSRISLECRDSDADRDRQLAFGSGRERRLLLKFTKPF